MKNDLNKEINKIRRIMLLKESSVNDETIKEDGAWRWESGVARGKANPLITPGEKSYGWESGVARGNGNPLYEEDENGDGILVYHGSDSDFDTFLTDFIGSAEAVDQEGPGVYFTTSKEDALQYGKYLYTAKLRPNRILTNNPKDTVSRKDMEKLITMAEDWQMSANDWNENIKIGLKLSLDAIMSEDTPKDVITQVWYEYYRYKSLKFVKNAVSLGYDGISVKQPWNATHYIIYNSQIVEIIDKITADSIDENYEYHDDDYLKGQDIYDYEPTQDEIKKFLAHKYQWKDWVELSKEADKIAKIERSQEAKAKKIAQKKQPMAFLRRLSAQVDYGPVALMNWKKQQVMNNNPIEGRMYNVEIDPKSLQEGESFTLTKQQILETSIPGGIETGLFNKTLMEDPIDEKVDPDFFQKNPEFYVSKNKQSLAAQNYENAEVQRSINAELKEFSQVDIDDIDIKPNPEDGRISLIYNYGDYLHASIRQYDASSLDIWLGANNFGALFYRIIMRIMEIQDQNVFTFINVEVDVVNSLIKYMPGIYVLYYKPQRNPATLVITKDKGAFIQTIKEIKNDTKNHIIYFNANTIGKEVPDYDKIGANRVRNKLKHITPDDIIFTQPNAMYRGTSSSYNAEIKDPILNAEVKKYHLINKPFFEYSASDHRVHNNGISPEVRNIGLGYKIYKAFIKKAGYITSDMQTTILGVNLYHSLLQDPDFYHIVYKKPGSANQKIYLIWKDYPNIANLMKKIEDLQINSNDYDIDPRLDKYFNI